jgi:FkbM family methyltransferase
MIPRFAKALLRPAYRRLVPSPPPYSRLVFAEQGEDALIQALFWRKSAPGVYVDVGAFHPQRFSVTYAFYLQGWRGINIEPRPGSKAEFDRLRPEDVNLELAVSDQAGRRTYYEFNEPLFNGMYPEVTADWQKRHGCHVVAERPIDVERLDSVLSRHLQGRAIDFMTIDVEGAELEVLRSNDWTRFRPEVVVLEDLTTPRLRDVLATPVTQFLESLDYAAIGKTRHTLVYRSNDAIDATRTD